MVYIDILSIDGEFVTANYRPERRDAAPGTLIYNKSYDRLVSIAKSPDEKGLPDWYVNHALTELRRMLKKKPVKMSGVAAWY